VDARYDSVLYVRKNDCTDETAEVDCNDDSPTGGRNKSHIERVLDPGKYFVFVDGYNNETGAYKLTVSTTDVVALSNSCRRAPLLASGASVNGSTAGAADDAEASCGGGALGADSPWHFDLAARARVRLVERSSDMSPVVHVRRSCLDASSEAACGEGGAAASEAAVTGIFDPGGYTVFADGRERDPSGAYTLSLETAAPGGTGTIGDGCGDAVPLAGASGTAAGDTFAARDDVAASCGGSGGADVVYRLDVPKRSRVRATLQGQEAPHVLVAWRRCGDRASEIACGPALDEVVAPGTYFVGVDGATSDAVGRFGLAWSVQDLTPQAIACASAPSLVERAATHGTTAGTGDRFDTSCGGHDVVLTGADRVFRFVLASRARVKLELTAPTFDAFLALRKTCGDTSGMLGAAQLACSGEFDNQRRTHIEATLERGTYWVVVDGQSPNDQGAFVLRYSTVAAR
jgi:hypothetical protein